MKREALCCFCGRTVPAEAEGLTVLEHKICSFCERQLVKTSVEEDLYLVFKEKVKKIWFR